jgi:hypothetical protein
VPDLSESLPSKVFSNASAGTQPQQPFPLERGYGHSIIIKEEHYQQPLYTHHKSVHDHVQSAGGTPISASSLLVRGESPLIPRPPQQCPNGVAQTRMVIAELVVLLKLQHTHTTSEFMFQFGSSTRTFIVPCLVLAVFLVRMLRPMPGFLFCLHQYRLELQGQSSSESTGAAPW